MVQIEFERQVGRSTTGKLYKSSTKHRTQNSVSIPSKMKTKFVRVKKQKGFGASSFRFREGNNSEKENPGPGQYLLYQESIWKDNKESQSRKGWGGFISNDLRIGRTSIYLNTGPGPGTYVSEKSKKKKKGGVSFAQASKTFHGTHPNVNLKKDIQLKKRGKYHSS